MTTTLLTPSVGNHFFAYHLCLKHPFKNKTLSSFFFPKVLKRAAKVLKIGSQIKHLRPKMILTRTFCIVKMLAREVTIFPEKNI